MMIPSGQNDGFPTPRHAVDYIMDTISIVKRKYDEKYGTYGTKETSLAIDDEMHEAMRRRTEYRTKLEPPPGDARCCYESRHLDSR